MTRYSRSVRRSDSHRRRDFGGDDGDRVVYQNTSGVDERLYVVADCQSAVDCREFVLHMEFD